MFNFAILGAGKIGVMRARLLTSLLGVRVTHCYDINQEAARRLAAEVGAHPCQDLASIFTADDVDAVLISTPVGNHIDQILRSIAQGKPVFCEKPLALDLSEITRCQQQLKEKKIPVQVGFNRRFDPSHKAVQQAVHQGKIGQLELLLLTSRDPGAFLSPKYAHTCGGLFVDTTSHDFDMARFVLGEEVTQICVMGAHRMGEATGEQTQPDTAMLLLRSESGVLCHINNSWRTNYGYDQRVEAFGSQGMIRSNNLRPTSVSLYSDHGTNCQDQLLYFFIERYRESYQAELLDFIDCVKTGKKPKITVDDGRQALILAKAAQRSHEEGRVVLLTEGGLR